MAFDHALDTLMAVPGGARGDARISAALDALIDRISALELSALARGDGFTETASEPATIDTLLSLPAAEAEAPPAPEVATTVRDDLATTAHDIPIPMNDRVLRFVELFQGRLRGFLTDGLARGAQYMPMIQSVFKDAGLPLDLAYVPLIESAFKPTALSRASARGVWQFMRGTGTENGLKHDWFIDERADPEKATRAAAKYLKALHRTFDDWHLALASYNGGPGRVQRAVRRSGLDDFWELSASAKHLPRETRDYVPMILAATIIARNPAKYGFDVPAMSPVATDVVTLSAPADSAPGGRVGGRLGRRHPRAQPRIAPLDDARAAARLPVARAHGHRRPRARRAPRLGPRGPGLAAVTTPCARANRCRRLRAACAWRGRIWRRPTTSAPRPG